MRERDLMDFLSKAGIYENAYNVVLQGDIVRFFEDDARGKEEAY